MIGHLVRRLLAGLLTLLATSALVYMGTEVLPGDVATALLGQTKTPEATAALRAQFHLDEPAVIRYLAWLGSLLQGDMGISLVSGRPVAEVIRSWLAHTVILAGCTALIAVPVAVALGLVSAVYRDRLVDRSISVLSLLVVSIPEFLVASILILVVAVQWNLLPATSLISSSATTGDFVRALVLPVATLAIVSITHLTRMTRAAILDVLSTPYVEMAILKGVPKWRIIFRHALPNAFGPIVNVVALVLGYLVSGVVIVEAIFSYPGLGRLILDSIQYRDMPVIASVAMIFCAFYVGVNLVADTLVLLTSPRLREQG